MIPIQQIREKGAEHCKTAGSPHYTCKELQPIDLIIGVGMGEDFCIGNILKYATRFKETRNLEDIKKVVDYAHILTGIELDKRKEK